jgi:hypothetical protein
MGQIQVSRHDSPDHKRHPAGSQHVSACACNVCFCIQQANEVIDGGYNHAHEILESAATKPHRSALPPPQANSQLSWCHRYQLKSTPSMCHQGNTGNDTFEYKLSAVKYKGLITSMPRANWRHDPQQFNEQLPGRV